MTTKPKPKRKLGRPPLPLRERKRNNVTTRLRDGLKGDLENAAAEEGRSLSEEIEFRLELSFISEKERLAHLHHQFGGFDNYAIAKVMARIASQLSDQVFAPWTENEWIYHQVREAFDTFLDGIAPPAGAERTGGRFISPIPKNQMSGKELGEYWLSFLQSISKMDEETKAKEGMYREPDNLRRIAFEVEPEIAPLIGRRKS